jgi:hypothetical protein
MEAPLDAPMTGKHWAIPWRTLGTGWIVFLGFFSAGAAYGQMQGSPAFARLHGDLKLGASQEGGWQAFEQAYSIDPQEFAKRRSAEAGVASLTGPQRVDQAIGLARSDLADLQRRGAALKAFYASLSPEQQHIFDRDTAPPTPGRDRPE